MPKKPPDRVTTGTFVATDRMRELVDEVLTSGRISYGDKSKKFERDFAKIHGCKYGTLSNSGTSALQIALQAMKELHGWERGDEVIVPATTFVATANVVLHNQMTPVFVDVDSKYYGIDPDLLEANISDRTRAIIAVHLFGQACNMERIVEIAKKHDIKIIEDSCETMFASHHGTPVGSLGDIGCFSTYVAHLLVTGVGGLSITNNPDYAKKMRSLVNHGLRYESLNLDEYMSPQPMKGRRFLFDSIGHSFRITELEAALGLAQLETRNDMLRTRNKNGRHYTASLNQINPPKPHNPVFQSAEVMEGNTHSYMMYPIVVHKKDGKIFDKNPLTKFLNDKGIETRDMLPMLGQPAREYKYLSGRHFPVSDWLAQSGFYVGCHQDLNTEHIQHVLNCLYEFNATYM